MKISISRKRRELLKLGSAAAILPVAVRAGAATLASTGATGSPSSVPSDACDSANASTQVDSARVSADLAYTTAGMGTYPEVPVSFFSKGKS
jgi:alpha-L-fucosidase 2